MLEFSRKTWRNICLVIAGSIVLYWLLHATETVSRVLQTVGSVVAPFVIGAVLAFILNVPMRGFERLLKGVKNGTFRRILALLLTFVAALLILALVFWLLIPQLVQTVQNMLPQFYDFLARAEQKIREFLGENPKIMDWINKNTDFENMDWANLVQKGIGMVGNSVSTILSKAFSALGSVFGGLVTGFIAMVFSVYCLFQKETLARQGRKLIYAFLPERFCDRAVEILRLSNSTFSNFLSGQCVEVCILGSMFAISMAIFRMPYIALVSVLVAVTAFIPVVGAWVGCIVGAFVIMVNNPMQAFWFVIMFVTLQEIENNLIYPKVVGSSIGLSGMWVLVAVALGNKLMGIAGMFLMIPVVSVLYTVLGQVANRRLENRGISADKLAPQPPDLRSRFKGFRRKKKKKDKQNNNE